VGPAIHRLLAGSSGVGCFAERSDGDGCAMTALQSRLRLSPAKADDQHGAEHGADVKLLSDR
jgi:hypothetical protein